MGGSLSIFKIISPKKKDLLKKTVFTTKQTNLPEIGVIDGAGVPKSRLTLEGYNEKENKAFYFLYLFGLQDLQTPFFSTIFHFTTSL